VKVPEEVMMPTEGKKETQEETKKMEGQFQEGKFGEMKQEPESAEQPKLLSYEQHLLLPSVELQKPEESRVESPRTELKGEGQKTEQKLGEQTEEKRSLNIEGQRTEQPGEQKLEEQTEEKRSLKVEGQQTEEQRVQGEKEISQEQQAEEGLEASYDEPLLSQEEIEQRLKQHHGTKIPAPATIAGGMRIKQAEGPHVSKTNPKEQHSQQLSVALGVPELSKRPIEPTAGELRNQDPELVEKQLDLAMHVQKKEASVGSKAIPSTSHPPPAGRFDRPQRQPNRMNNQLFQPNKTV